VDKLSQGCLLNFKIGHTSIRFLTYMWRNYFQLSITQLTHSIFSQIVMKKFLYNIYNLDNICALSCFPFRSYKLYRMKQCKEWRLSLQNKSYHAILELLIQINNSLLYNWFGINSSKDKLCPEWQGKNNNKPT